MHAFCSHSARRMKIIALNLWHGGGTRIERIAGWLEAQEADLLLLTEWRANAGGEELAARFGAAGYSACALSRGARSNGLLLLSRTPGRNLASCDCRA